MKTKFKKGEKVWFYSSYEHKPVAAKIIGVHDHSRINDVHYNIQTMTKNVKEQYWIAEKFLSKSENACHIQKLKNVIHKNEKEVENGS